MGILESMLALLGGIESDAVRVDATRCISVRHLRAECQRCVDSCTTGALQREGAELVARPELCIGCGTCAAACPTSAIETAALTDEALTEVMRTTVKATKGHPVFACEKAIERCGEALDPQQVGREIAPVTCLGRLDESALVGLAAYRSFDATLVCGDCEGCPQAPGGAHVRKIAKSSQGLAQAFGSAMQIAITEEMPSRCLQQGKERGALGRGKVPCSTGKAAASASMDRRGLFTSAKEAVTAQATQLAAESLGMGAAEGEPSLRQQLGRINAEGTLPQFVPSRRTRLYNYLNHIGQPVAKTVTSNTIGTIAIDADKCRQCRMCATFCPTGALRRLNAAPVRKPNAEAGEYCHTAPNKLAAPIPAEAEGEFGLLHRPAACVQCRACEQICPAGAITVSDTIPLEEFMGKKAIVYRMKPPTWQPNKPDSMYMRIHEVLGSDLEMCMF